MNEPLVSANITTYNRARLVSRAIESVLGQSYRNLEVVVVDDCSTDNTEAVVREYALSDQRVRYIRHISNHGNARARNTALAQCRGEFVAFMDDDDVWIDDRKIEKQVEVIESQPWSVIVCTGVRRFHSVQHYRDLRVSIPAHLDRHLLGGNSVIFNSTVLMRREFMVKVGGFDARMPKGVDSEFFRRCVVKYHSRVYAMPDITTAVTEYGSDRMTGMRTLKDAVKSLRANIRLFARYPREYASNPTIALARIFRVARNFAVVALRRTRE